MLSQLTSVREIDGFTESVTAMLDHKPVIHPKCGLRIPAKGEQSTPRRVDGKWGFYDEHDKPVCGCAVEASS